MGNENTKYLNQLKQYLKDQNEIKQSEIQK